MEQAKDEQYYLIIPDPISGEEKEFDLNRRSNVGLVMRLIRKRESIMESMGSNFDRLDKMREDVGLNSIDERFNEIIDELQDLEESDFESEEKYKNRVGKLEDELQELDKAIPDELVDLQEKSSEQMEEVDRIGIKICTIILNPVNGVPDKYPSKKDFIGEFVGDDADINQIIHFFLSTLNSTTKSRKDEVIQMKKRNNKKGT